MVHGSEVQTIFDDCSEFIKVPAKKIRGGGYAKLYP